MRRFYLFCLIIIIVGIILNAVLYFNKAKEPEISENKNPEEISNNNKTPLKRPIAFMINNIPEAWPQSGIYAADYVYEMLVEGGLTRLMAVYTTNTEVSKIGPVRSARHNFLDLSMEYDAIYAHFGGSPKAFTDIAALKIPSLNGIVLDGKMYWRDKNRKAPHNAYTSITKTLEYAKNYGYDKDVTINHFTYNKIDKAPDGNPALNIEIPYSYSHMSSYTYDTQTGLYKRFMRGNPHIDDLTKSQLCAKNIIIQFAKNTVMDDENRQDIFLVGTGRGYFISGGKYINIKWEKKSRSGKTMFYDENGKELSLNNGQTWIQIVPIDSKVSIK